MKNELYSFSFFKKSFENIKLCTDRVSASQLKNNNNDPNIAKIAAMSNYKIYAACDLAMGLVMSKTQNFLLKEFPVQPSLPGKYFSGTSASSLSLRCLLTNFILLSSFQLPLTLRTIPKITCLMRCRLLLRNDAVSKLRC